jgi:hypothetical protein
VEGERSREIAAGLAGDSLSAGVALVEEVLYCFQRASTWRRERAGRFSSDATSDSKQYAQWASVAMVVSVWSVMLYL